MQGLSSEGGAPLSGAGMEVLVNLAEALAVDVRVDLRGGDVRVSQHHLHAAQIGAPLQKVRCERVAQHVGAELATDADGAPVGFEDLPEALAAHGLAAVVEKERGRV